MDVYVVDRPNGRNNSFYQLRQKAGCLVNYAAELGFDTFVSFPLQEVVSERFREPIDSSKGPLKHTNEWGLQQKIQYLQVTCKLMRKFNALSISDLRFEVCSA